MRISKISHIIDAQTMRAIFYKHFFNVAFQFSNKSKHHLNKSRNIYLYMT